MNKIIKYPSGLRLALHTLKNTRSMAIGLYIGAGSACETAANNGISHFIEHMLFKGTQKRSAFEIAEAMESAGAQINAFTSREVTSFYTISTDEHTEKCFDVLSDLFFNATLSDENIQKEKGVILEEISMCEDDPTDLVMTLLSEAYFGNSGLGRSILGTPDTVNSLDANSLREYMSGLYTADNLVLAVAGNTDFNTIDALVKKYFEPMLANTKKKSIACDAPIKSPRSLSKHKPIEQANLAFAFPSYKYNDKMSLSVALLSNVLGGGMSSRLFQKLREELALVYDIFTSQSEYIEDGFFVIYLATNPEYVEKAVSAVKEVLVDLKANGISQNEFEKGREQLKSAVVLGAERAVSIMRAAGGRALLANKTFDITERLNAINAITVCDVNNAIAHIFNFQKAAAAYVGKDIGEDILKVLNR